MVSCKPPEELVKSGPLTWSRKEIELFARPVPRYTSYPTAPHFSAEAAHLPPLWLADLDEGEGSSLYIHIPFCDKLCWFCGCHTKQIMRYDPIKPYLEAVYREMELLAQNASMPLRIDQVHLGGGSPSMLKSQDLATLRHELERNFILHQDTAVSVEIDPSDVTDDTLVGLKALGLTRASIGVQDFNSKVQREINRIQSFADTSRVAGDLRQAGITSLNIDALYGLPHQTCQTLQDSLEKVLSIGPDRIAMFGYAHVPWLKKHQTMIDESVLPDIFARFEQARLAEQILTEAGYTQIGIDHFARSGDSLLLAAENGRLRRNFQGYTDDNCQTIIGLGASSIGRTSKGYYQNITATGNYIASVRKGELPIARGHEMTADDHLRAHVIEEIMCTFALNLDRLKENFGAPATEIARESQLLLSGDTNDHLRALPGGFEITSKGKPFARSYAARFDRWLTRSKARYSMAV